MIMDDLRTLIGRDIHAVVACVSQIDAYIERMYSRGETPGNNHPRPVRAASETSMRSPALSVVGAPESPPDKPEEPLEQADALGWRNPWCRPRPSATESGSERRAETRPARGGSARAPHLSPVGDTAKAESEAVDALLAATELVNGSAVGSAVAQDGPGHPEADDA